MAERAGISRSPQFLHAAAGAGSHAACDLYRLETPWLEGRADRRRTCSCCPAPLVILASVDPLCDAWPASAGQRTVLRHQGGGSGHRRRGVVAGRASRPETPKRLVDRRLGLPGALRLRRTLPADHRRRGHLWISAHPGQPLRSKPPPPLWPTGGKACGRRPCGSPSGSFRSRF